MYVDLYINWMIIKMLLLLFITVTKSNVIFASISKKYVWNCKYEFVVKLSKKWVGTLLDSWMMITLKNVI